MNSEKDQILFISTYPPRECGIATFTQDIIHACTRMFDNTFEIIVCALEEDIQPAQKYPKEVVTTLNTASAENCIAVANYINSNKRIVTILIEHEFGLFAGEYGEHIFSLLDLIQKPVFICFHTVLSNPVIRRKEVVRKLAVNAEKIIVLTTHSKDVLESDYQIHSSRIIVIPHGVHLVKPVADRSALKKKFGFGDKIILSTFGLISSNKGIETALEAIATLPEKDNIVYLVMGRTHPCVLKNEGEKYRDFLVQKTIDLGLEDNVLFINKYIELKELLTYLKLTDIYLFTSKDPYQTVSGTLSYAVGSGCTVVSTPIPHAIEMLKDDVGYLFDFGNNEQLKNIIEDLIKNPERLKVTSINASRKARSITWENVANKLSGLFKQHLCKKNLNYNLPPIQLNHFCNLTTLKGMLQFSQMCEPDFRSGYTTDDNARALYVLTIFNELYPNDVFAKNYFGIYLNFLEKALTPAGHFLNYVDHKGEFTLQNLMENLDEANARAFVALCRFVQSNRIGSDLKTQALGLLKQTSGYIYQVRSPRSVAKIIKGLYFLNLYKRDSYYVRSIQKLSEELIRIYDATADADWHWFEPYITYNNSSIPEGLMYAYLVTNNSRCKSIALASFDFLIQKTISSERIRVISNNGWINKNENYLHKFGEQPMEIASMLEALHIFYLATGETRYKTFMDTAFSWFLGNNHLQQMVYNPVTGGCHDGVEEFEININQGAESTLSYIISRLTMDKLAADEVCFAELLAIGDNKSFH